MLLNRVRCEAMEKIRVYFDRNLCRFLPPKESIFLICDTLLSFHNTVPGRGADPAIGHQSLTGRRGVDAVPHPIGLSLIHI